MIVGRLPFALDPELLPEGSPCICRLRRPWSSIRFLRLVIKGSRQYAAGRSWNDDTRWPEHKLMLVLATLDSPR
jgi:hypothetical protein